MVDMQAFWKAFLSAQQSMRDPCKDASNPHFRSKFVSLKGVADAVRPCLHDAGIVVTQLIDYDDAGTFVRTVLAHTSGGSIESRCPVICSKQNDAQAMGSAVTYARRYALAAICGVAPSDDDDDGEGAVVRAPVKRKPKSAAPPAPKAVAFESPKHALDALGRCTEQGHIDAWAHRVKASQFQGLDLDNLREATKERRAAIADAA